MASELENWWSKSYGLHSIRDLQALPVFSRFKAQHYPYERSDDTVAESFKVDGPLDTFEWSDKGRQEGEIFSHDRLKDEWTYEHRFQEPECKTIVKATLKKGEESGSISRVFASHETSESWRLHDKNRWYETFTLQNGEKNGMRAGQLPATDGQENWTEKFFEKEGQSNFEKTWERPGAKGGENKQRKGDLWWGEVWHTAGDDTEKKMWHIQGDKDWGHTHGESCGKIWDEKWEIEDEKRSEEKIIQDGDRKRGFRYVRNGRDWYKQEWDGLKMQGLDEEAEKTQLARFRGTVDEIGVVEYDFTLKGEHTLQLLLRDTPHFAAEVEALKQERLTYPAPDREDINSLLEAERFFGALNDKQERLKQRMIEGRHSDIELYLSLHVRLEQALTESNSTLQEIAKMINTPEASSLSTDWEKRVNEAKTKPFKSYYGKAQTLLELIERIEAEKRAQLKNLVDKEEINKAMETLYQVMVKHDAVSDKIIELAPDAELKKKLDGFEDKFEEIHQRYQEEADPKRLHENIELLLAYQPIHLYLVGRLRGYNKDEVTQELGTIKDAMDETKTSPSLKNTRAKVRSGRGPKDTPFQLVDRALNRLLPFFVKTISAVRGDKETSQKLEELVSKSVDGGEPFEIIIQKASAFANAAEAHAPQVDTHEGKVTTSDTKLDALLLKGCEELKAINKNPELLTSLQGLLERHYPQENMDLQLAKEEAVAAVLAQLADEIKARADLSKDAVKKAMDTIYLVMAKNDAVSDKLIELAPNAELKAKLDDFENQFEEIHAKFQEEADPKKLQENLDLLLAYQPINLYLAGRIRGYVPDEVTGEIGHINSAVDETKESPSLKSTRIMVRSARPAKDTPFQLIDRALNRLLPFFAKAISTVRGDKDTAPKLEALASKTVDSGEPFEIIIQKAIAFADAAEAHAPQVDTHEGKVTTSDTKLDALLLKSCEELKAINKNPELLASLQGLLERHYPQENMDLQLAKEEAVAAVLAQLADEIKARADLSKDAVKKAMDTIYLVMAKNDAVSDKLIELAPNTELKAKLDDFENQFEGIQKKFQEEADPKKLQESLDLLLAYQPINLFLAGRIRGYVPDEVTGEIGHIDSAVDETKGSPSLKSTRAKVRSARPAKDTPFQLVDRALNRLVPFFVKTINTVRGNKDTAPKLEALASKTVDSGEPFEIIIQKAIAFADAAEAHAPQVDTHEGKVTTSDTKLDALLLKGCEELKAINKNPELLASLQGLLERHYPQENMDLQLAKEEAVAAVLAQLADEIKARADLSKDAVKKAMDTIYLVMAKNDAVSDKLIELAPNAELKAKLDDFENQFEEIHAKFQEEADPKKLQENLDLLLAYQPINLYLAGRIRGYVPDEVTGEIGHINSAVDETKESPSLKSTRIMVRSARPAKDTPFQLIDRALNRLLPFFAKAISTVRGDKDTIPKLGALASKTVDSGEPFEILIEKAAAFADAAEAHASQIDTLEAKITTSDQKLDVLLTKNCAILESISKNPDLLAAMKALLTRHYPQENIDLVIAKEEAVDAGADQLADEIKARGNAFKDTVSNAMELLYQIMVKNDAVSDKLIELAPDVQLKTKLDGFEDKFEELHEKFQEEEDPNRLHENLQLLLDYQPIHLHLVGRLRGYNPDEVTGEIGAITAAVDETKGAPSLKSTRSKVRSGRGTKDSPFQLVDRALNRLLPFFVKTISTVRGDDETSSKLTGLASKSIDSGEPFEIIIEKANAFAEAAEAHTSHVGDLENELTTSDEKLDVLLEKNSSALEALERNPELLSTLQGLLNRHYADEKFNLQLEKEDVVDACIEELIAQINDMTETIETTTTETNNYITIIEEKSNEIYSLKKMLEEKDKKLKQLSLDLEEARKYKPLYENKDNECAELIIELKKAHLDVTDLQLKVNELTALNENLSKEVHELQEFKIRALNYQNENERLQGIINSYTALMGDKKEQFEEVIGRLNKSLADKDSEIEALKAAIEKLEQEVKAKETGRRKQLMLRVIFSMSNTLKAERISTFLTWKANAEHEPDVLSSEYQINIPELKSTVPTDEQEWTDAELATFTEAEKAVFPIREEMLRSNVIFKYMRTNLVAFQQPMPVLDFFKLMDELLLRKADVDVEDLQRQHRPANFPEFLFESLLRSRGAKHLAQQDLSRLIPTLHEQFSRGNAYGVLLARLLHMFHHSPAPLEGLVLVTRYNKLFVPLLQTCPQVKQEGKEVSVETAITGGEALLSEVLDHFYEQVGPEPAYQRALLRHLLPAQGVTLGYLLFLVKWSLAKKGKSAGEFWTWANAGGSATPESLITAVTHTLGLNVSPRLIKQACGNKPVDKATFDSVFAGLKPADFHVTKGNFLTGILEGFFHKARRNVVEIAALFAAEGSAHLTKEQFTNAVHKLKGDVPEELVTKMHEYGVKHSSGEPLDKVGFTRALLRSLMGKLEVQALTVPELHALYESHVFEFDLDTGIKIIMTKTTTTKVVRTTVRVVKKA